MLYLSANAQICIFISHCNRKCSWICASIQYEFALSKQSILQNEWRSFSVHDSFSRIAPHPQHLMLKRIMQIVQCLRRIFCIVRNSQRIQIIFISFGMMMKKLTRNTIRAIHNQNKRNAYEWRKHRLLPGNHLIVWLSRKKMKQSHLNKCFIAAEKLFHKNFLSQEMELNLGHLTTAYIKRCFVHLSLAMQKKTSR